MTNNIGGPGGYGYPPNAPGGDPGGYGYPPNSPGAPGGNWGPAPPGGYAPAPGYPPPGYPPPGYGVPQAQPGNGMAIAALVTGIVSLALCWVPFVGPICAILAVVFGGVGISKAGQTGGTGKGMAIAGLVLGIVFFLVGVAIFASACLSVRGMFP